MFGLLIIVFISLFDLICAFQFLPKHGPKPTPTPYHDWDYLMFSQRWPVTSCTKWEEAKASNTCNMPPDKDRWIIHGIWPTKYGLDGPLFCPSAIHFDPGQLEPILDDLNDHWTNIENNTKPNSFWKHEWDKHGTCAVTLPELNSIYNYFTQALEWNKNIDLSQILDSGKIVPGLTGYNLNDIYQVLQTHLKVKPMIECEVDSKKNFMISEIRVCFNKSLQLIDCDYATPNKTNLIINCNLKKNVMYYKNVPQNNFSYEMDYFDDLIMKNYFQIKMYYVQLYRVLKFLMWFTT